MALDTDGTVYTWGNNDHGQLGDGSTFGSATPIKIQPFSFSFSSIVSLAAGSAHALALTSSGVLYSWGANLNGQVGNGTFQDCLTPTNLAYSFYFVSVTSIGAGETHSIACNSNGEVFVWGGNELGQLGDTYSSDANSPISFFQYRISYEFATKVIAGANNCFVITSSRSVFSWGDNSWGQLAQGSIGTSYSFSTMLNLQFVFAANLFDCKTCIEYDSAYEALSDDYDALSEDQKSYLANIDHFDYSTMHNPDSDDYNSASKNEEFTAREKWDAIRYLHENSASANVLQTGQSSNINTLLVAITIIFTIGTGALFFYRKRRQTTLKN